MVRETLFGKPNTLPMGVFSSGKHFLKNLGSKCVYKQAPWPHTPEVLTVAQLWGHLEEVIVLQVQRPQLVQPLQLHGVDGSHLVVAEQDGLQGWEAIQDTGKHLKSSGRERRDSQEQGIQKSSTSWELPAH